MQVDDEHLSLTDQKDQVREPLLSLSDVYEESPVPLTPRTFSLFLRGRVAWGLAGSLASPALAFPAQLDIQLTLRLHLSSCS